MKNLTFIIFIFFTCTAQPPISTAQSFSDAAILKAIYRAEGGEKATYLYGIRSAPYSSPEDARRICLNTIRNNRRRYAEYGRREYDTYLEFLASRYAPIGAENDPRGLNHNWLKNVRYFLVKERGAK